MQKIDILFKEPTIPTISSLLTEQSPKTSKGVKYGYLTGIQYLSPSDVSGMVNLCSYASEGCRIACLNTAGRASFDAAIPHARLNRTIWYVKFKAEYWTRLIKEIRALERKAQRLGLILCLRLNGTSDQPWERIRIKGTGTDLDGLTIFQAFPNIIWYDYTKYPIATRLDIPENYHLTYSYSEDSTLEEVKSNIALRRNVAVVFNCCRNNNRGRCFNKCLCPLPTTWHGIKVISGDDHDLRFLDESGVIVGLHAKGKARQDTSGFVVVIQYANAIAA